MQYYEDDCLQIDLPDNWHFERQSWVYQIMFNKNRFIVFQLWEDDNFSPKDQYEHFKLQFTYVPKEIPGYQPRPQPESIFTDPFVCGSLQGFCNDTKPDDRWPYAHSRMVFLLEEANLSVDAYGLTPEEHEQLLASLQTLRLQDNYLLANEKLAYRSEAASRKTKTLNATDLTKPRKRTLKTWMDHQMVLLMDSDSYPEDDNPFVSGEEIGFIMPCNDKAAWITSVTEFDVTLVFVVRANEPKPRKAAWNREARAKLSVPSGQLHVEQTTGGPLMQIDLEPGDYHVIAQGFTPEGSDASDEGVEKIQVTLVPIV